MCSRGRQRQCESRGSDYFILAKLALAGAVSNRDDLLVRLNEPAPTRLPAMPAPVEAMALAQVVGIREKQGFSCELGVFFAGCGLPVSTHNQ